jgi:hypothetical protein
MHDFARIMGKLVALDLYVPVPGTVPGTVPGNVPGTVPGTVPVPVHYSTGS